MISDRIANSGSDASTMIVSGTLYKNSTATYTTTKKTSIMEESGVPVRNERIWSSSLTLATVSPTRLDSKYLRGKPNK